MVKIFNKDINIMRIGIIHSLTQIIALRVFLGEDVFLLPLALSENIGWVMFGLWIVLNFLCLPFIIILINKNFNKRQESIKPLRAGLSIIMTGVVGGFSAIILDIIYYKFSVFSINKAFDVSDYSDNFLPLLVCTIITIIIGEVIRIKGITWWNTNRIKSEKK
ncbi:MAG: hypothetical protein NTX03_09140 [Bacteroidetes bacterium]|nr:hypothetical protein [Bacteroidota bacterium]